MAEKKKIEIETQGPMANDALEATRDELLAIPPEKVRRDQKLEPLATADMAIVSRRAAEKYRPVLEAEYGERATSLLHRLPISARALQQADVEYARLQRSDSLATAREEVKRCHNRLFTELESCAQRGLIDGAELDPARPLMGYQETRKSTLVLVSVARESWPRIEGQTQLTKDEIDYAEYVALGLGDAVGSRDRGLDLAPIGELRTRALSRLVDDYEELRRMMTFIRWHDGDVDEIVPSLWSNRGRRSSSEDPESGGPPPVPTPGDDNPPFTP